MLSALHPLIASKREALATLCRLHGIVRLDVFGSAARVHDFDPARSDVDLLVTFEAAQRPQSFEAFVANPYIRAGINQRRVAAYGA